jgi:hypothetical protein
MAPKSKDSVISFVIELVLYAALVSAYFFLVLHFLGDSLVKLYQADRRLYATAALLLIVCQGLVLETITTGLLRWIRSRLK